MAQEEPVSSALWMGYRNMNSLINGEIQWNRPFTLKTTLFPALFPIFQRGRTLGYRIEMHYIALTGLEDSLRRLANRYDMGRRYVPVEEVKTCFASRWQELSDILPLCDDVTFYDNDCGFQPVGR